MNASPVRIRSSTMHLLQVLVLWFVALLSFSPTAVDCLRNDEYDYIIVGGGTAGLAVATRLSLGLPNSSILVIEAGPKAFDDETVFIPGMAGRSHGGPLDWILETTPQPGLNDRSLRLVRGKVLGGSSALNFMVQDRAAATEYDAWQDLLGNEGWDWETMIAAMIKAENFTGVNSEHYGSEGVGTSGPVQAIINRRIPEQQEAWIPTLNNLGIEWNRESLGGDVNGVMYQPSSIDVQGWVRSYSATTYLPLAGSNVYIWTETRVAKVNLDAVGDEEDVRATGVTLTDGTVINARSEVILSAGALLSPGLLELSGIGRSDIMSKAGITQVVDLPGVGENLQDHVRASVSYQLKDGIPSIDILKFNQTYAAEQLALYYAGEEGLYDHTGSAFLFANWVQTVGRKIDKKLRKLAHSGPGDLSPSTKVMLEWLDDPDVPQLEIIFSDGYGGTKGYPANGTELFGKSFFTFVCGLMHPLSRGTVHIASSNIEDKPDVNPNFLSHEYDVESLVQTLKYARKVARTSPLSDFHVGNEYEPGLDAETDDELRMYVRNTTGNIHHPLGTAAMLPREDGGVVDHKLRVYGTKNLRVVDASVIPVLISAHICTAVYGVAEIAADLIIREAIENS